MGEKLRIYVGGLGLNVTEDDLMKTFTSPHLGTVDSVEILRTKGRSFAYLEFIPASYKGISKLFSTLMKLHKLPASQKLRSLWNSLSSQTLRKPCRGGLIAVDRDPYIWF